MTTFIITILLVVFGVYLITTWRYHFLGVIMCFIFGFYLLIHSSFYFTVEYRYELYVEKRNAFEQTLKEARKNGNEYEVATIIKQVAEWNQYLAEDKYNNKTILFDQYIDDRVELLKPIK